MTFKGSSTAAWATHVDFHLVVAQTPLVTCAVLMMLYMTAMWDLKNNARNILLVLANLASAAQILTVITMTAVMLSLTGR